MWVDEKYFVELWVDDSAFCYLGTQKSNSVVHFSMQEKVLVQNGVTVTPTKWPLSSRITGPINNSLRFILFMGK